MPSLKGTLTERFNALTPVRKHVLVAGALFVFSLAAYCNSFTAEFQYDDLHSVVENHNIRTLTNLPRFFTESKMSTYLVGAEGYRPVTTASYAVNYAVSGYDVRSYHLFNFLLHIINALLVYFVVLGVLKGAGRKEASLPAGAAALLFAVHPIQTYAVTYVSGRAVLLASFFYLMSFYLFIRVRSDEYRGTGKWLMAPAIPLLYLMGLLSKEMAVSLPAAMLAYDLVINVPRAGAPIRPVKAWFIYPALLAVLSGYLVYKKHLMAFMVQPDAAYGTVQYLMSEAKALLMYVRLLLLPMNQNIDYHLPLTQAPDIKVVLSALMVGAALVMLYHVRKGMPAVSFFGLWFFIAVAPESSLVPIHDIAAEYRLYLPSVGFIAAAVLAADGIIGFRARRVALAGAAVLLFGLLTLNRNAVWATEYSLWSDVLKKNPTSFSGRINRGKSLYADRRYFESLNELDHALKSASNVAEYSRVRNNMGLCYFSLDMMDDAVYGFNQAISAFPDFVEAYENLGKAYFKLGRFEDAAKVLQEGARLNPGYSPVRMMLAGTYARLGRNREALREIEEAMKYAPRDFLVRYDMAVIYESNGMHEMAVKEAEAARGLAVDESDRMRADALLMMLQGSALQAPGPDEQVQPWEER